MMRSYLGLSVSWLETELSGVTQHSVVVLVIWSQHVFCLVNEWRLSSSGYQATILGTTHPKEIILINQLINYHKIKNIFFSEEKKALTLSMHAKYIIMMMMMMIIIIIKWNWMQEQSLCHFNMTIQMSEKPETHTKHHRNKNQNPGNLVDMRLTICHINSVNQWWVITLCISNLESCGREEEEEVGGF